MRRHIVLVGLPGAGKSAVGRATATALGCAFCDLDTRVEAAVGMSVAALFAQRGEPAFRAVEREAFAQAMAEPAQVVAPGGGWAAQPGALDEARGRALTIYLVCGPDTAAARLPGSGNRPLLAGDMLGRLHELAAERTPFYARAEAEVPTDGRTVADVTMDVVALARSLGGW